MNYFMNFLSHSDEIIKATILGWAEWSIGIYWDRPEEVRKYGIYLFGPIWYDGYHMGLWIGPINIAVYY